MKHEILESLNHITAGKEFAVGNDLVFLPDFTTSLTDLFKDKVYTKNETAYCQLFDEPILRYASTWAAKEAVYKALKQLDASATGWKNIEIIREKPAGQPLVVLHKTPDKFKVSLTISHDGDYVWAIALIQINPVSL